QNVDVPALLAGENCPPHWARQRRRRTVSGGVAIELCGAGPRPGAGECRSARPQKLVLQAVGRQGPAADYDSFRTRKLFGDFTSGCQAAQPLTATGGLDAMNGLNPVVMRRLLEGPPPPAKGQFVATVVRPVIGQPVSGFESGCRMVEAADDVGEKIGIRFG